MLGKIKWNERGKKLLRNKLTKIFKNIPKTEFIPKIIF